MSWACVVVVCPSQPRPNADDKVATASAASNHWGAQYRRVAVLEFSRDRKTMSVLCEALGAAAPSSGRTTRRSAGAC